MGLGASLSRAASLNLEPLGEAGWRGGHMPFNWHPFWNAVIQTADPQG